MRRKLGIVILMMVTAMAGAQEASHQFHGLKSSVTNWTRAGLWSGLIVYAQPVTDGSLPSPQIYYMMPQTAAPCPEEATLAGNNANAALKPATKNNHTAQGANAAAARAVAESVEPEFVAEKLPLNFVASTFAATRMEKPHVFVEVAKTELLTMTVPPGIKLGQDAEALAKLLGKELDVAKFAADAARIAEVHERVETVKMKALGEVEKLNRRIEIKVMRRPERPATPRVVVRPFAERRADALPEMSGVVCEKTRVVQPAPKMASVGEASPERIEDAHILIDMRSNAALKSVGNVWALGCDTGVEQQAEQ